MLLLPQCVDSDDWFTSQLWGFSCQACLPSSVPKRPVHGKQLQKFVQAAHGTFQLHPETSMTKVTFWGTRRVTQATRGPLLSFMPRPFCKYLHPQNQQDQQGFTVARNLQPGSDVPCLQRLQPKQSKSTLLLAHPCHAASRNGAALQGHFGEST